jgi:nucleotide-binding universal stress UspA family protein
MNDRQTIVVAVDFEAASDKALALASELAERLGCELALVHVYQLPIYTYPGLEPGVLPAYQSEVTAAAKRALDALAGKHGVKRAYLRQGDPATEVLAALDELRPKLAVVGTHGRRGLSHLLLGSVAEKIVRRATVPVVTVRADEPAKA